MDGNAYPEELAMANEEHLARLKDAMERNDIAGWNKWRKKNIHVKPYLYGAMLSAADLSNADLSGAALVCADLRDADLSGADLTHAELNGVAMNGANLYCAQLCHADLSDAILIGTNLGHADLSRADLSRCFLSDAVLSGANLRGAILSGANLSAVLMRDANLSEAIVGWTIFAHVDFSEIKGLETVGHQGPSSIGIDTLYKSMGTIPEAFLRGAGVPDGLIRYIHSNVGPSQFHSCFISYSSKDEEFAHRLHVDLQSKGVRCWFAPHDIKGGRKLHEQIDEAVRRHDRLLLILSEHSMNSEWVKTEIAHARQKELKEQRQTLFPVSLVPFDKICEWKCFDADTGKDSAREIREYFIPDFSNWMDRDAYNHAFNHLLRDLKAEGEQKAD
jgi:hypothetical protein